MKNTIQEKWNHFFYQKESPFNLSVTRAFFFLFLAQYTFFQDQFSKTWSMLPAELWHPVWPLALFSSPPLTPPEYAFLFHVFIGLCVLCGIGLFTKFSTLSCALIGTLLYAFRVSFLEGSHDNLATVVFLWIFAVSSCGYSFSLDSFRKKEKPGFTEKMRLKQEEGAFHWPLKLMMIIFCSIYVSAGFSKIYNGGFEWIWGDTVKHYFIFTHYKTDLDSIGQFFKIGLLLSSYPLLCKIGGLLTLCVEIGTPLAFINKKLKIIIISSMFFWHVLFFFTSSNGFFNMTLIYFCWIDWSALYKKISNTKKLTPIDGVQ